MSDSSEFDENQLSDSSQSFLSNEDQQRREIPNLNFDQTIPEQIPKAHSNANGAALQPGDELLDINHILFEFDHLDAVEQCQLDILQLEPNPIVKIGSQLFKGTLETPLGSLIVTDWNNTELAARVVKFQELTLKERSSSLHEES